MSSYEIMFIAGDPSGDRHAASVIQQLKTVQPEWDITGIGGPYMEHEGLHPLLPFARFNKMGFFEVVPHLPFFLGAKKQLISYLRKNRPRCLVCVDYSGFNIPMMKAAYRFNIPVVWYIAPMVWAWKKKRAAVLGKYASSICCIFPFECAYFKPFTANVHFVGNPVVEAMAAKQKEVALKHIDETVTIAFIPGSRVQEVTYLLPVMVEAYTLLKKRYPSCRGIVSMHPSLERSLFNTVVKKTDLSLSTKPLSELLSECTLAVVTSGTATLETALAGIPHIIVYKTSVITYSLFRFFIVLSHIGLPNIIAQETVAPELVQQYVTDKGIVQELSRFFDNPDQYRETAEKLIALRTLLGSKKPSVCVAEEIQSIAAR